MAGWGWGWVVSAPDPTDAAADGLHHRYACTDVIHPQLRMLGLGPRLGGGGGGGGSDMNN